LNSLPLSVRPCLLALALIALAITAAPADAAAKPKPKHGVTAAVAHRTLTIVGDRHANKIALRVKRRSHNTLQVDAGDNGTADFSFDRRRFDRVVLRGGSGNDVLRLDEGNGAFITAERASLDGQGGSDRLVMTGSAAADNFGVSAAGARVRVGPATAAGVERVDISGGRGADLVSVGDLGGTGVRQLSFDGGDDADRLTVAGSSAADSFGLGHFGPFVHVQRDAVGIDAIRADRLDIDARAGADSVALTDLAGTDLKQLNLALGGGDGQADSVVANGSDGSDGLVVTGGFGVGISGLAPAVAITGTEPSDALTVDARGGDDAIDARGLPAGRMRLTLRGGPGTDLLAGSPGDDTFRSEPGDGADGVDGNGGIDTAVFDGSAGADALSATTAGESVHLARAPDGGLMTTVGVERVALNGLGGPDTTTLDDLAQTQVTQATVDLGTGDGAADSVQLNGTGAADNVRIAGGGGGSLDVTGLGPIVSIAASEPATDTLTVATLGGSDSIDSQATDPGSVALRLVGGPDHDVVGGSAGDDTFVWNPGDDSDSLNGNQGTDTLQANGSDATDQFAIATSGGRDFISRFDGANNTQEESAGVERVAFKPLGGSDLVAVPDLSGSAVGQVQVDLAAGDGALDRVSVSGTPNADTMTVTGDASAVHATAGPADVSITHADAARDTLSVGGLGGADNINASGLAAGAIGASISGGQGNDTMIGSQGDDTFTWNPGDASDTIDGGAGTDTLQFNGANIGEKISLTPNGSRFLFTRDVANVSLDVGGTEHVNFLARGSADVIDVGDLSGTPVTQANFDLSNGFGAGDAAADTVTVQGTGQNDVVSIAGSAGNVTATGLPWAVGITGAEAANDRLLVRGANGDDVLEAPDLTADGIGLSLDGGNDNDVLLGGAGNDTLSGGFGDDFLNGGPGQDSLDGGPGNNVVIQ
jgi:Ca2+-binding RTX toxin-like protein